MLDIGNTSFTGWRKGNTNSIILEGSSFSSGLDQNFKEFLNEHTYDSDDERTNSFTDWKIVR
jgi:hypothetical protein